MPPLCILLLEFTTLYNNPYIDLDSSPKKNCSMMCDGLFEHIKNVIYEEKDEWTDAQGKIVGIPYLGNY